MSREKFNNFSYFYNDVQKEIDNFILSRNQLNKRINKCIDSFQIIEREIYKTLFDAREYFNEKCHYCTKKIKKLRRRALEFEELLDYQITEKKNLQNPKLEKNFSHLFNSVKNSIRDIDDKIDNLNQKVKNQILDIKEEIYIVEKINRLERKKKIRIKLLSKIETDVNNSHYYQILRKCELLEIHLKEIYKRLNKWSNKRRNNHKKMLELYREATVFRNFKNKMENILRVNKDNANQYYQQFLKVLNQNEKKIIEEKLHEVKYKPPQRQKTTPRLESFIEKKKLYRKLMQDKLAIALEKQKAGKKIHISEYKLILKHAKK